MQNFSDSEWKYWDPVSLLNGSIHVAVMILNQPLCGTVKKFLKRIWDNATLRITVDGGTQQLYDMNDKSMIPDMITGDFDSVDHEILQHYESLGSRIFHTPDQDETDFTKAVRLTLETLSKNHERANAILALSKNSGRLDHIMGNIQTLFLSSQMSSLPVFLLGDESLTWILEKGKHKIKISPKLQNLSVGLIPVGEPCSNVTTSGLKWNLTNSILQFGGLISTSNTYDGSEIVTVETDKSIMWTMEINLT